MQRPVHPGSRSRLATLFLPTLAFALVGLAAAPARTLTSQDGRSIEVEILGFEGLEKVRFKRADTGQIFTTPISTFSATDQEALAAEAKAEAAKPRPIHPGDLVVEVSRVRYDSRRTTRDVSHVRDAVTTTDEDWGYGITLRNNTRNPIEGLRAEYILFVEVDVPKNTDKKPGTRRQGGKLSIEPVPPAGRLTLKTDSITTREVKLKDNVRWSGTSDNKTRDTLTGVWLRIYRGDELVLETASSPKIISTNEWRLDD